MKKYLSLLLAVLMTASLLAGCGGDTAADDTAADETATPRPAAYHRLPPAPAWS